MKKILYVVTKSNWGGAQRYVFDLATNLPADGFSVAVAFGPAPDGTPGILAERLRERGIRTILVPELGRDVAIYKDIAAFFALVRLCKAERPDVIHLNSSKAAGLGTLAARITRVPRIIFTAHGWPFWEDRGPCATLIIKSVSWLTAMLSHVTICISEYDRSHASRMPLIAAKLRVIRNGITPIEFVSREEARAALFPAQRPPADALWVVSIAEHTANKNLTAAAEAIRRANAAGGRYVYVAIGDGEQRDRFVREHENDTTVSLPFVPDASRYLNAFDVLLLPSRKEGVPYVLLEAAQARLPVIATDVGGIPEVIDAQGGFLVAPDDLAAVARALRELEKPEVRSRMGTALHAHVSGRFSFEVMIKDTQALYS